MTDKRHCPKNLENLFVNLWGSRCPHPGFLHTIFHLKNLETVIVNLWGSRRPTCLHTISHLCLNLVLKNSQSSVKIWLEDFLWTFTAVRLVTVFNLSYFVKYGVKMPVVCTLRETIYPASRKVHTTGILPSIFYKRVC